ncbi:MAG: hypothetical protein ACI9U2_001831 [Bradymonadia bacterium]|jgi:hypothetical protein
MPSSRPAPPRGALAPIVDDWLRGDAKALLTWLDGLDAHPLWAVERMWWELSTALGTVIEPPHVCQGDRPLTQTLAFAPPLMTGGAPQRLVDADQTARAWMARAQGPPTRTRHRLAMRETQVEFLADAHPTPDDAFALLRHHTDDPVDFLAGRPLVGPLFGALSPWHLATELQHLAPALTDPAAFDAHLLAGLKSTSLPRHDLSWRLLRLPR